MQERVGELMDQAGIDRQHELRSLAENMSTYILSSKSMNTSKKYFSAFTKWRQFAEFYKLPYLPAESIHVSLYLTYLIDRNSSASVINSALYSIRWAHSLKGYADPTDNDFVKNLQDSANRLNSKPVVKKDPVTSEMLVNLCNMYKSSTDLLIVRDLTMIVIGFSGFLRFDELSSLICKNVKIFEDHLCILIDRSKTDQYRHGNEILISSGNTEACPVSMYKRYIALANLKVSSEEFIFRPIFRSSGVAKLIYKNKKMSYTSARENIVRRLKIVAPSLNLGLHSLRSGGATMAAMSDVSERCIKRHGRWKSDLSKDGYIDDTFDKRLAVSKSLRL